MDPHGHFDIGDCSLFRLQRDRLPDTGKLVNAMVQPNDLSIRLNSRNTRTVASNHNDEHRTVKISSPPTFTESLPSKKRATPNDCSYLSLSAYPDIIRTISRKGCFAARERTVSDPAIDPGGAAVHAATSMLGIRVHPMRQSFAGLPR